MFVYLILYYVFVTYALTEYYYKFEQISFNHSVVSVVVVTMPRWRPILHWIFSNWMLWFCFCLYTKFYILVIITVDHSQYHMTRLHNTIINFYFGSPRISGNFILAVLFTLSRYLFELQIEVLRYQIIWRFFYKRLLAHFFFVQEDDACILWYRTRCFKVNIPCLKNKQFFLTCLYFAIWFLVCGPPSVKLFTHLIRHSAGIT